MLPEYRFFAENAGGTVSRAADRPSLQVSGDGFFAVWAHTPTLTLPPLAPALTAAPDGYSIEQTPKALILRSASRRGVLYGLYAVQRGVTQAWELPQSTFRALHIDLRFGFWREEHWAELLDRIAALRYNTLLLETENRLPFQKHPSVTAPEHFTDESLRRFLALAADRFLEVIPLQQTLGHLEYVLKLPAYYPLREVREHPAEEPLFYTRLTGANHYHDFDEICPSDPQACALAEDLLDDALRLFPDSRSIHIGCDEAWNLLYCDNCRRRFPDKTHLLTAHLNRVAARVLEQGKTPILWDDMLRRMSVEELKQLDPRIVVMSWLYFARHPEADAFLNRFAEAGLHVLGAASAKCSIGTPETLDLPDYDTRFGNMDWWASCCDRHGLPGFAVTVWSNYSGTIAPPHPLFDSAWLPIYYGARRLWDHTVPRGAVLNDFCSDFFGVDIPLGGMSAGALLPVTEQLSREAVRARGAAVLWHLSVLLSLYRLKSAAIGRELYRYRQPDLTAAERGLLDRRVGEVRRLRHALYPQAEHALQALYSEREARLFLDSRFLADDTLYGALAPHID